MVRKKQYTFIDLFAGCGGLTEGFLQTGRFEALAHVEWDKPMVDTLRHRLIQKWNHSKDEARKRVVCFDVQKTNELIHGNWSEETKNTYGANNSTFTIENGLVGLCDGKHVDMIIGGPPCQAYSIAGRAQDPNSMKLDYRNYLFESFVKIVDFFRPEIFVFENVPGLLSACPGNIPVTTRIYDAFNKIGYTIRDPKGLRSAVYCAEDYETPQKRNRIIIIGTKKDCSINIEDIYNALTCRKSKKHISVREAIGNMPKLLPLDKPIKDGRVNISHTGNFESHNFSKHIPRYHNKRDIKVFKDWLTKDMNKFSQKEKLEYYTHITGKTSNHIKYRSLEWDSPSPTIVAHLHKDGLMFIHPDIEQLRSITIREAACLQSFPLDYEFVGSNPYCYKMIGNAVPVQFAKNIALAVCEILDKDRND